MDLEHVAPTVYYDGSCPVCAREIAVYRSGPGGERVRWIDASRCDPTELGADLARPDALSRLHLRQPDGTLVSGAQAFTLMWQALPRWSWLGRAMGSAPMLGLLEPAYRFFLKLRALWRPTT